MMMVYSSVVQSPVFGLQPSSLASSVQPPASGLLGAGEGGDFVQIILWVAIFVGLTIMNGVRVMRARKKEREAAKGATEGSAGGPQGARRMPAQPPALPEMLRGLFEPPPPPPPPPPPVVVRPVPSAAPARVPAPAMRAAAPAAPRVPAASRPVPSPAKTPRASTSSQLWRDLNADVHRDPTAIRKAVLLTELLGPPRSIKPYEDRLLGPDLPLG